VQAGHTAAARSLAPAQLVGKSVNEALAQMAFSQQSRARAAKTVVERALLNADFYHGLGREALMVERAWTGRHLQSPRIRYHSKARAGRSHWRTSMLTVRVREMNAVEAASLNKFATARAEKRAALDPRGY